MSKHSMRLHTTVEEVIRIVACFEDSDTWILIGTEENGDIRVDDYEGMRGESASTLLEALYLFHPDCYCDNVAS